MPDETYPIKIGEEKLLLYFGDPVDVERIEETISFFEAFHPHHRTYKKATAILWRSLYKVNDAGELVHAIQQGPPGEAMAFEIVKQFCGQFHGPAGMLVLYGSFDKALIAAGWYGEPVPEDKQTPQSSAKAGEDLPKNSVRPTNRPTRGWRMACAGLLRKLSGIFHRKSSTP